MTSLIECCEETMVTWARQVCKVSCACSAAQVGESEPMQASNTERRDRDRSGSRRVMNALDIMGCLDECVYRIDGYENYGDYFVAVKFLRNMELLGYPRGAQARAEGHQKRPQGDLPRRGCATR